MKLFLALATLIFSLTAHSAVNWVSIERSYFTSKFKTRHLSKKKMTKRPGDALSINLDARFDSSNTGHEASKIASDFLKELAHCLTTPKLKDEEKKAICRGKSAQELFDSMTTLYIHDAVSFFTDRITKKLNLYADEGWMSNMESNAAEGARLLTKFIRKVDSGERLHLILSAKSKSQSIGIWGVRRIDCSNRKKCAIELYENK